MSKKDSMAAEGDLFTALCGAFLAALITLGVQWCFSEIGWGYVAMAGLFGFFMGWWSGQRAIEFLKDVLRHT